MRLRLIVAASLLLLCVIPRQKPEPSMRVDSSPGVLRASSIRDREAADTRFIAAWTPPPMPVEGNVRAQSDQERRARVVYGTGACGGDLPSCSILECESGGNLTAQNPHSTASGKWQILDTSWRTEDADGDGIRDSYHGYSRALDAPEDVQDDRAREIWAGGAGRSQWVCR